MSLRTSKSNVASIGVSKRNARKCHDATVTRCDLCGGCVRLVEVVGARNETSEELVELDMSRHVLFVVFFSIVDQLVHLSVHEVAGGHGEGQGLRRAWLRKETERETNKEEGN